MIGMKNHLHMTPQERADVIWSSDILFGNNKYSKENLNIDSNRHSSLHPHHKLLEPVDSQSEDVDSEEKQSLNLNQNI